MLRFSADDPDIEKKMRAMHCSIYKAVVRTEADHARCLVQAYQEHTDLQYLCSTDFLFEILPLGTGKGVCAEKIRTLCPRVKCIVGIGDYENDISLLEAADIAVAVDGGFEPLKAYADWVAPSIEKHPIAWLVEKLGQEIRAGRIL